MLIQMRGALLFSIGLMMLGCFSPCSPEFNALQDEPLPLSRNPLLGSFQRLLLKRNPGYLGVQGMQSENIKDKEISPKFVGVRDKKSFLTYPESNISNHLKPRISIQFTHLIKLEALMMD